MPLRRWWEQADVLPGAPGARRVLVMRDEWRQVARDAAAANGRLLALWASNGEGMRATVYAALLNDAGLLVAMLGVDGAADVPTLEEIFPSAGRMERAMYDLSAVRSTATDQRPWLRHASWPSAVHPLRDAPGPPMDAAPEAVDTYPFVRVQGDGVHEIPVGPVHAGIIEPGHFRFSIVGEKVLRLEAHLGYVHKGIELRFTQLPLLHAHKLAARVSGDSAVAGSWAYCQALEGIAAAAVPVRALWLRALALELERLANHLGDLGALGNDAGFAFGYVQFMRLKELLLRNVETAFGQRYLMDMVVPGGVSHSPAAHACTLLAACIEQTRQTMVRMRKIYDEHPGVRDRFDGSGRVPPGLAARLGLLGMAGRASGQSFDVRVDLPCVPYSELRPEKAVSSGGDVAARVNVRFDEAYESCRLISRIIATLETLPPLIQCDVPEPAAGSFGIGVIEGWRGPVLVALEAGEDGALRRCHPHDPSWQNWPVLEHAIIDNIVPDFPLINKSFNLSYSGHDL